MVNHRLNRSVALVRTRVSVFSDIGLCLSEARPIVQVIFLLRFITGATLGFGSGGDYKVGAIVFGALIWECAIVFVYLLNGTTDMVEDRINDSRRPLARGLLSRAVALRYVRLAGGMALAGGALMGTYFFAGVAIFMLLGYLYSAQPFQFKRSPSATVAVATLGGLVTYLAGSISAGVVGNLPQMVCAVAMSLWMGLVGATSKDFSDADGDIAAGRRTMSTKFGEHAARWMVGVTALALGGMFLAMAIHLAPILIISACLTMTGAIVVAYLALSPRFGGRDRMVRRGPYRAFMTTQYAAHAGVPMALVL